MEGQKKGHPQSPLKSSAKNSFVIVQIKTALQIANNKETLH